MQQDLRQRARQCQRPMRRADHGVVACKFFLMLELAVGSPARRYVEEGVAEHGRQPDHQVVAPCHMPQFMGQHRLKLTALKVCDQPAREHHRRSNDTTGERQWSVIEAEKYTAPGGAELSCQVMSE